MRKVTKKGTESVASNETIFDMLTDVAEQALSLDEDGSSISNQMLSIAKNCKNVAEYISACETCELQFKARHNTKTMPRAFVNPKSVIKRSWDNGIDILAYDTESQLRKALYKETKKNSNSSEGSTTTNISPLDTSKSDNEGINAALAMIINELHKTDKLDSAQRVEILTRMEDILQVAVSELVSVNATFAEIVGGEVEIDEVEMDEAEYAPEAA